MNKVEKLFAKLSGVMCALIMIMFASCGNNIVVQLQPQEVQVLYKVEHWKQNISGSGYTKVDEATQTLVGMTGSYTQAAAKTTSDYEGFIPQTITQVMLTNNNTTVVKIYYDRKTINYTFDANGGLFSFADDKETLTISGRYEAQVIVPSDPSRSGYDFTGWDTIVPAIFGAVDKPFTAQWKVSSAQGGDSGNGQGGNEPQVVQYTVEHWLQNAVGDEYTKDDDAIETKSGTVGEKANASSKDYYCFTVKNIEDKTISADGTTVVKIYYDREIITYIFNAVNGKFADGKSTKNISGRYEAPVPSVEEPSYAGHNFLCWNYVVPDSFERRSNYTFTANWAEQGEPSPIETTYTIEYYQQNINNDEYSLFNTFSNQKSYVGAQVNEDPLSYDGFTPRPVQPVTIEDGGVSVIKVYYDRNIITYTFNPNGGNWNGSTANVEVKGKFGAAVTAPANPTRAGYDYRNWDYNIPETFGKNDQTFTAWWTARTDIPYTVEYWLQNVDDDGYTREDDDTEDETGEVDTDISLYYHGSITKYSGFTRSSYTNLNINGDGSSVIKFYYDRNTITYTFLANDGNWIIDNNSTDSIVISGRYGAAVNAPSAPSRTNYAFTEWKRKDYSDNGTDLQTFAPSARTFEAQWEYNEEIKNYTVEHWWQNISDNEYTKHSSETKSGVLGANTAAVANAYPGFTAQSFDQTVILEDESATVKIYYNRNEIIYTFKLNINASTADITETKRYGDPVARPSAPVKDNYNFINWYSDSTLKNEYDFNSTPSENTTIYAGWKYIPIQAKQNVTIDQTSFAKTEEIYVIDPAKTGADITVVQGKEYVPSNNYGPFREGRTVSLSPFIMGKYEVTQQLYTYVMTNQEVTINGTTYTLDASPFGCLADNNYPLATGEHQSLRPAENITWYDAVYFCNKLTELVDGSTANQAYTISNLQMTSDGKHIRYADVTLDLQKTGYRLPTEAEWEFAFRGGNPLLASWDNLYSGSNSDLDSVGWYKDNSNNATHEVGLKEPNALGIYDMSGNVNEWCYDWQSSMSTGPVSNPVGGTIGSVKMMRGGSVDNSASGCAISHRDTITPETKYRYYGFRLARSVTQ